MKIILISTISNLGKIGDVVEVKNGYAKNLLIPSKKAICFTTNNYKIFQSRKQEFEQENQKNLETANIIKQAIEGKDIIIIKNASDDGRLYGSVSNTDIANKVNELIGSKSTSRTNFFLKKPIKEIGVYQVRLTPHSEISFDLRLIVTRSESEVEALLNSDKKIAKADIKSEEPQNTKASS
jgi:large subunit ribosomal protein L9